MLTGLGRLVGARAGNGETILDLGIEPASRDLAAEARIRRDEIKAAFEEGRAFGEKWIPLEDAWRLSSTRRALPTGRAVRAVGDMIWCPHLEQPGQVMAISADRVWLLIDRHDQVVELRACRSMTSGGPIDGDPPPRFGDG